MVRKVIELQGRLIGKVKAADTVMIKSGIVKKNTPSGYGTNKEVSVVKVLIRNIGNAKYNFFNLLLRF